MGLTAVIEEVAKVLEAIELPADSALRDKRVNRVYPEPPKGTSIAGTVPCFIIWADASPERLRMGNLVEVNQTLQLDFFGPDTDLTLRYAREYFDATMRAIHDQQRAGTRFNESVDLVEPRTERPQEASMLWGNVSYPGFRIFLDLQWFEDVS